jgi:hypothetical protein
MGSLSVFEALETRIDATYDTTNSEYVIQFTDGDDYRTLAPGEESSVEAVQPWLTLAEEGARAGGYSGVPLW